MTPMTRSYRLFGLLPALHSVTALLLCAAALVACANPLQRYTVPEAQLQQALAKRFPVEQRLGELLDVRLSAPRLSLLPATNRLGTELDINLLERLGNTRYAGSLALDYGLRFDSSNQSVRLADVRVSRLNLSGVPPAYQELFARYAPRLAERLLDGYVLHQFSAQDLGWVGSLGLEPAGLQVTPAGLSVALQPRQEKAAK